jgi:hypothetical protein
LGWQQIDVFANQVIISGTGEGLWVYNGTPALGNLIASITSVQGTDPYGNLYQPGITSYTNDSGIYYAASMQNGEIVFSTATNPAGPYTSFAAMGPDGSGNIEIGTKGSANINLDGAVLPILFTESANPGVGPSVFGATGGDVESVSGSDGGLYGPMPAWKIFNGAQTISSTTGNDILGTSSPVSARKYHWFAYFLYSGGQAGGTANFAMDVSAGATSPYIFGNFGNGATFGEGAQSGATGQVDSPTLTTGTWTAIMAGSFVSSGSGTFALHCQMSAAGDSVEILNGFMVLIPI